MMKYINPPVDQIILSGGLEEPQSLAERVEKIADSLLQIVKESFSPQGDRFRQIDLLNDLPGKESPSLRTLRARAKRAREEISARRACQ